MEEKVINMNGKPKLSVVEDAPETKKGGGGDDSIVYVLSVERVINGYIVRAVTDKDEEVGYVEEDRETLFKRLNELL